MGKKASRRLNSFLDNITLSFTYISLFWIYFCTFLGAKNGGPVPDWAAYLLIVLMLTMCILVVRFIWIMNKRKPK